MEQLMQIKYPKLVKEGGSGIVFFIILIAFAVIAGVVVYSYKQSKKPEHVQTKKPDTESNNLEEKD